ncbi:MAG: hypothetical protein NVSMB4_06020 [Acidimicrobiales bacterium]
MKRTPLHRRTPLGAGAPLARPRTPRWGKSNRKREAGKALRDLYPQAEARANGSCEVCGIYLPLELHHRLKRSGVDRERLSNYLMACAQDHHEEIHGKPQWANVQGWRLQPHQDPATTAVLYRGRWVYLDDEGGVVEQ